MRVGSHVLTGRLMRGAVELIQGSPMPIATGATDFEDGGVLSVKRRVITGAEEWIPASAGITEGVGLQGRV